MAQARKLAELGIPKRLIDRLVRQPKPGDARLKSDDTALRGRPWGDGMGRSSIRLRRFKLQPARKRCLVSLCP